MPKRDPPFMHATNQTKKDFHSGSNNELVATTTRLTGVMMTITRVLVAILTTTKTSIINLSLNLTKP